MDKYNLLNTCYQYWNGNFFEHVNLKSLGLCIQLGHSPGETCPLPMQALANSFTVVDSHGIHEVGMNFCGCGTQGTMTEQLIR